MQNNAKIVPIASGAIAPAAAGSTASGDFRDSRAQQEADQASRYRLVIEEGPAVGTFIYKTLDRVTGEVVKQLPREQVVELMRAEAYNSGSVIDTRA